MYIEYFNKRRESLEPLKVFEIGAGRHFVLLDGLASYRNIGLRTRKGKTIYREIHDANDEDEKPSYDYPHPKNIAFYRERALPQLKSHQYTEALDMLSIPWDIRDIPYPFEDNYFDEIHCHMMLGRYFHFKGTKKVATRFGSDNPFVEDWVQEIKRLASTQAIFFTTIQDGQFFEDGFWPYEGQNFYDLLIKFGKTLNESGFGVQLFKLYPQGEENAALGGEGFSYEHTHAGGVILAQHGLQCKFPWMFEIEK